MKSYILTYGIAAGLLMALWMALLSITGDYEIGLIKYLKYAIFATILWIFNLKMKKESEKNEYFQTSMLQGFKVGIMAATIVGVTAFLLYLINPALAPMKFNLIPETKGQALTISAILFFEILVFGFIINFILIQGFKPGAETVHQ